MTNQSLLARVKAHLPAAGKKEELEAIAKGARVPYHTLLKIVTGETEDPRVSTVERLLRHLERGLR